MMEQVELFKFLSIRCVLKHDFDDNEKFECPVCAVMARLENLLVIVFQSFLTKLLVFQWEALNRETHRLFPLTTAAVSRPPY